MTKVPFLSEPQNRRWVWRLLLAVLIFLLLAWGVWLYFTLQLQQLHTDTPA